MGCNESKHDVVTGTTVTRRKKLSVSFKKKRALESIPEADSNDVSTKLSVQKPEPTKQPDKDYGSGKPEAVADVKEMTVNTESKEEDVKAVLGEKENSVAVEDDEHGRLISRDSPDHFFSSRKDEEAVEAIVAEEGLQHFLSAHGEPKKVGEMKESEKPGSAVEKKALVDNKEEKTIEADTGKVVDLSHLTEEILVEESKAERIVEENGAKSIEDEKNPVVVDVKAHNL